MSNIITQAIIEPLSEKISTANTTLENSNKQTFSNEFEQLQFEEKLNDTSANHEALSSISVQDFSVDEINITPPENSLNSPNQEDENALAISTIQFINDVNQFNHDQVEKFSTNVPQNSSSFQKDIYPAGIKGNAQSADSIDVLLSKRQQSISEEAQNLDHASNDNLLADNHTSETSFPFQRATNASPNVTDDPNLQSSFSTPLSHEGDNKNQASSFLSPTQPNQTANTSNAIITTGFSFYSNGHSITDAPSTKLTPNIAAVYVNSSNDTIEIQLAPEELGKLQIKLDFRNGDIPSAIITAERSESLDLMRNHENLFHDTLKEAGIDNAQLSFGENYHGNQNDDPEQTQPLLIDTNITSTETSTTSEVILDGDYQINIKL